MNDSGILRRSASKIAKADSTSVFSGIFSVPGDIRFLWVKFSLKGGVSNPFGTNERPEHPAFPLVRIPPGRR
jgi:hypothetical protein